MLRYSRRDIINNELWSQTFDIIAQTLWTKTHNVDEEIFELNWMINTLICKLEKLY